MLRPNNFGFNNETKSSNPWQNNVKYDQNYIAEKALSEFDDMVAILLAEDIVVEVLGDSDKLELPDAIFLNNWFTVMPNNELFLFPLAFESRRGERRPELIDELIKALDINSLTDLSDREKNGLYLESTGSIIFDHRNKVAYASVSKRTNEKLFNEFCDKINYQGFIFNTSDLKGLPVYHTNVVLSIAENYALICLSCIENTIERALIVKMLEKTGKVVIDISIHQMENFAGNSMEVIDKNGQSKLVMSRTGYSALKKEQIDIIEKYSKFVIVNVSIIERVGGGSARCMMMGVPHHLNG